MGAARDTRHHQRRRSHHNHRTNNNDNSSSDNTNNHQQPQRARSPSSVPPSGGFVHVVRSPRTRTPPGSGRKNTSGSASAAATAGSANQSPGGAVGAPQLRIETVVDEEQLHKRLLQSVSERQRNRRQASSSPRSPTAAQHQLSHEIEAQSVEEAENGESARDSQEGTAAAAATASESTSRTHTKSIIASARSKSHSASSSGSLSSGRNKANKSSNSGLDSNSTDAIITKNNISNINAEEEEEEDDEQLSPPAAIIIPASVAKSLSARASRSSSSVASNRDSSPVSGGQSSRSLSRASGSGGGPFGGPAQAAITREQLEYGPVLRPGEVQVLYRSSDATYSPLDRHLKEEQAKQVAPSVKQSPIAITSVNPTYYQLHNKPLILEYPATVENLRLNNTGFSWEVKIPYQISMNTSLRGAHLQTNHRFRLDQFHCHWGERDDEGGSEHTVDNRAYSAEMHFVHYNMDKYHTLPKAARHPDGLVVVSVFMEANEQYHNHAELEKIVNHLRNIQLKGEHSIIKQAVRIENLLPQNRSYWSYQGSLTTPPYLESVTWFVMKQPIKCNTAQIKRFRNLKSSLRHDQSIFIKTNHRKTQPLNGRTIVTYDEQPQQQHYPRTTTSNPSNSSSSAAAAAPSTSTSSPAHTPTNSATTNSHNPHNRPKQQQQHQQHQQQHQQKMFRSTSAASIGTSSSSSSSH